MSPSERYKKEYYEVSIWSTAWYLMDTERRAAMDLRIQERYESLRQQYRALSWWTKLFVLEPPGLKDK